MDENGDRIITRDEWQGSRRSFRNHDWNHDGVLSGYEVAPGARRFNYISSNSFAMLDINHDGSISAAEWNNNYYGGNYGRLSQFDDNGDGILTRVEYLNGTSNRVYGGDAFAIRDLNRDGVLNLGESELSRSTFSIRDYNGDGFLTRGEYFQQAAMTTEPNYSNRPSAVFTQLDLNGDGYISRNEWQGNDYSSFTQIDFNNDGYISRSEIQSQNRVNLVNSIFNEIFRNR
jgi:Ca2+-binding EF-hand superfamily protein